MKDIEKDILAGREGLRDMPYGVPEGYFDALKHGLKGIPASTAAESRNFAVKKAVPYMATAAAFALLLAAGGFFLRGSVGEEFTEEDYLVFSDDMTSTIFYEVSEQYADAVTDDDIIEYLIYTGVGIEDIEIY